MAVSLGEFVKTLGTTETLTVGFDWYDKDSSLIVNHVWITVGGKAGGGSFVVQPVANSPFRILSNTPIGWVVVDASAVTVFGTTSVETGIWDGVNTISGISPPDGAYLLATFIYEKDTLDDDVDDVEDEISKLEQKILDLKAAIIAKQVELDALIADEDAKKADITKTRARLQALVAQLIALEQ